MDEVTIQYTGDAPVIVGHQYMFPGDVRTVPRFLFEAAAAATGREKFVVDGEVAPSGSEGDATNATNGTNGSNEPPQAAATSTRKKAA